MQLNCMFSRQLSIYPSLSLEGDQYRAYTFIIQNLNESKRKELHFFVTGPAGTGKSYLLHSLLSWFEMSKIEFLVLALTGIAANNINSALSIVQRDIDGQFRSSLMASGSDKQQEICKKKIIIIDEISMVDADLFTCISILFARLHENSRPFGNLHVLCFGDLMQLPPVSGRKIFHAPV